MPARIEKTGKPVTDYSNVYLTQSTTNNYKRLHQLDVLGLDNISHGDQ